MTEVIDEDKSRKITEAVEYLSIDDDAYKVNVYILNHGRKNVMAAMELNKKVCMLSSRTTRKTSASGALAITKIFPLKAFA